MSIFTYTATRELAPGTSPLELVTRDFRLLSKRKARKPVAKQNTALAGDVESILYRSEQSYSCRTALIEPGSIIDRQLEEFLASVENAEVFTFDRYGTNAVPDNPVQCIMVSKSFPANEIGQLFHQYSFVIRES